MGLYAILSHPLNYLRRYRITLLVRWTRSYLILQLCLLVSYIIYIMLYNLYIYIHTTHESYCCRVACVKYTNRYIFAACTFFFFNKPILNCCTSRVLFILQRTRATDTGRTKIPVSTTWYPRHRDDRLPIPDDTVSSCHKWTEWLSKRCTSPQWWNRAIRTRLADYTGRLT